MKTKRYRLYLTRTEHDFFVSIWDDKECLQESLIPKARDERLHRFKIAKAIERMFGDILKDDIENSNDKTE